MENNIQMLREKGQSLWCDNISRKMLASGSDDGNTLDRLDGMIRLGVVGMTSNPTIFMKAITSGSDYDQRFNELLDQTHDIEAIYEGLVLPDITEAADKLRPIYDRTDGLDGYVSLEVNPKLAYETESTIAEGRRLFARLNRPNVMIKVPATPAGVPAIETLIGEGINVNVTLVFSIDMHERVMQAYLKGLKRRADAGGDLSKVASVASFFVSRVDTLIDQLLIEKQSNGAHVDDLLGKAAVANARLAYQRFEKAFDLFGPFGRFASQGARVQRPLWASTSTKNPDYPDTKYVDELIGPHTVNTLPPQTITAMLDHGCCDVTIRDDLDQARSLFERLADLGIDSRAATDKLTTDGVAAFVQSYDELLVSLEEKRAWLRPVH